MSRRLSQPSADFTGQFSKSLASERRARDAIAEAERRLFGRELGKPDLGGITLRRSLQQRAWRKKRLRRKLSQSTP
jgi:hypothetical protein